MVLALACVGAGLAVLRCRKADWAACPPAIYLIACSGSPAQDEGHIKWPSLRAELAMNFEPAAREGAPLLTEGLISGYSMPGCIQSGTGFPDGRCFGKCVPESALRVVPTFRLMSCPETMSRN